MSPIHYSAVTMSASFGATVLVLGLASLIYARGWRHLHKGSGNAISPWRLASFLSGLFLVWGALGSPLVAYDHEFLTVHMIQHLLLMTFAPALILLGEPLVSFWHGLPRFGQNVFGPLFRQPLLRRFGRLVSRPGLCWIVSALALLGWHVPSLFALGMHSELLHSFEQASFFAAGLLFWWPVLQPWPCVAIGPPWWTLLYLFLATLPCDLLSGFLVFSDRVAYPLYFSTPRHLAFSTLEDQQCAAALMWTCVTLVYLVPAVIISTRLLSPGRSSRDDLVQSESAVASQRDPQRLEAV